MTGRLSKSDMHREALKAEDGQGSTHHDAVRFLFVCLCCTALWWDMSCAHSSKRMWV